MKKQLLQSTVLATILGMSMATSAFAATVDAADTLAESQTFSFWLLDSIVTLDPQLIESVEDSDVARQLFEGLYTESADGDLIPAGATDYTVSDDNLTYTFKLRPEAKWSNGDPVTAADYVYAWQRLVDPATASSYSWYLELMQIENATAVIAGEKPITDLAVKAVDDLTLEVKLSTPLPYFVKMTVHSSVLPTHKATIEAHGQSWTDPANLVGNGAYTLTEHKPGEKAVVTRNPMYWNDAATVIQTGTFLTVNDENIAFTRYEAGELDTVGIPTGMYPQLSADRPDEANSAPRACTYYYLMNMDPEKGVEALMDVNVRKALSFAIDRNIITDKILQSGQIPAYTLTPAAMAGFTVPAVDYAGMTQEARVEEAKRLLAEAGFTADNPLKLTLNYNTSEGHKSIAVAVQQFYKAVGVELTLNNMEWQVHSDIMHDRTYEMARSAWCGDYNEASTFLDLFTSSSGFNDVAYQSDEYDALMAESKTMADPQPNYTKAEELLAKDMPIIPIYHYTSSRMLKTDVKGYPTQNVFGNWYLKELYRTAD
jgi:oligopeptide transport system substrate-binding protein